MWIVGFPFDTYTIISSFFHVSVRMIVAILVKQKQKRDQNIRPYYGSSCYEKQQQLSESYSTAVSPVAMASYRSGVVWGTSLGFSDGDRMGLLL